MQVNHTPMFLPFYTNSIIKKIELYKIDFTIDALKVFQDRNIEVSLSKSL